MPLSACPRCKKMFNKTADTQVCSSCDAAEKSDYEKVREVLAKDSSLNAEQAAKAAEVPIGVVQRMLKEGSLAVVNPMEKILCGRCGERPAISAAKRLCEACLDKLNAEVAQATQAIKLGEKRNAQVGEYLSARRSFDEKSR